LLLDGEQNKLPEIDTKRIYENKRKIEDRGSFSVDEILICQKMRKFCLVDILSSNSSFLILALEFKLIKSLHKRYTILISVIFLSEINYNEIDR
jgi:hypothetical protein